jgi:MmyB-like transcription regulator ligand binding domain
MVRSWGYAATVALLATMTGMARHGGEQSRNPTAPKAAADQLAAGARPAGWRGRDQPATPSRQRVLTGAVGAHQEDRKIVAHPAVGPITVDCDVITEGDADRKIVILPAAPDTEDETKLRLTVLSGGPRLRSWLSR